MAEKLKCSVEGCKKEYRAKGYCDRHYKAWKSGELGHARYKICETPACKKKRAAQGAMCEEHAKKAPVAEAKVVATAAAPVETPSA